MNLLRRRTIWAAGDTTSGIGVRSADEAKRRWVRPAFLVAGSILVGSVAAAPAAGTPSHPLLFGTREVRSANLALFPKWTGVLDRTVKELGLADGSCKAILFGRCPRGKWMKFLDGISGADPMTQLTRVNRYMNRAPYILDPRNYNVADYWATPRQFFRRDGDCEDYAIAKFLSLREMDVQVDELRLYIVDDLNLRVGHAILAVYAGRKVFILDNQLSIVVEAKRIRHYKPIYSLNEEGWWRHRVA